MHILFVTHYYAPDSGAAANRLTRLAEQLAQRGHQVTVLTPVPHYPQGRVHEAYRGRWTVVEARGGVRVVQVWLWTSPSPKISRRLLSQLSFMLTCSVRGLFVQRPDVMFVENQPIFTGLAAWLLSKIMRVPYVLNVSDFWPEYLHVAGVVSQDSRVYRLFAWLTNLTQRHAAAITTLYDGLIESIEARIGPVRHSQVIYSATDLDALRPGQESAAFRAKYALGEKRWVTFLGVLGPHIDLETMLAVALHFRWRDDLGFLFVGTGGQKDTLASALSRPEYAHCRWIEWVDADELPGFWATSSITYWALHDNPVDKMRFQAKLYEVFASGTPPVIAVEGLMSVVLARTGVPEATVAHQDVDGMIAQIERLLNDVDYCAQVSAALRAYAEANFSVGKVVSAYEEVLRSVRADE